MTDAIEIREFRPTDAKDFERLNREWIEAYFQIEKKDLEQLQNPQSLIDDGGQIFLAVSGREVIGTCAAVKVDESTYEIAKMAVDRSLQSRGLGRRLLQQAERWIIAQGATKILILTNSALEAAVHLYETSGYTEIHRGPHPAYQRADLIFAKQLL